jgi:uncharacterized protein (DUF697 family)
MRGVRSYATVGAAVAAGVVVGALLLAPVQAHVTERFGHVYGHIEERFGREIVSAVVTVPGQGAEFLSVSCPTGKSPLGGGVDALQSNNGHNSFQRVIESYPTETGWEAFVYNDAPAKDNRTATVYAICGDI